MEIDQKTCMKGNSSLLDSQANFWIVLHQHGAESVGVIILLLEKSHLDIWMGWPARDCLFLGRRRLR